jgi:uncharacterized protein YacL
MVFVEGLRLLLVLLGLILGLDIGDRISSHDLTHFVASSIGVLAGYVAGGIIGRAINSGLKKAGRKLRDIPAVEVLAGALLGTAGLVLAAVFGIPILILTKNTIGYPAVAIAAWILAYVGMRIGTAKAQQIVQAAGLSRKLAPSTEVVDPKSLLLDTSALMDRSFWVLAKNNLFPGDLVIPRFVIDELKLMVDSPEIVSAKRARRALEILDSLSESNSSIVIAEESVPQADSVDEKALVLAGNLNLKLGTTSNKVCDKAAKMGIAAINLYKLSNELLPEKELGERFKVELVKEGAQSGQAIGYSPDGDMIVVNDASHLIGKGPVTVETISSRRTSQGVLVFAKIANH